MFKEIEKNDKFINDNFCHTGLDLLIVSNTFGQKYSDYSRSYCVHFKNKYVFEIRFEYFNQKLENIYLFYTSKEKNEIHFTKFKKFESLDQLDEYIEKKYTDVFKGYKKQLIEML